MLVSEILRIKGNALFTTAPDGTVLDAVKVMAHHDIGSLVVMDHGRMVGMLTFAEVLRGACRSGKGSSAISRSATSRSRSAHRDAQVST